MGLCILCGWEYLYYYFIQKGNKFQGSNWNYPTYFPSSSQLIFLFVLILWKFLLPCAILPCHELIITNTFILSSDHHHQLPYRLLRSEQTAPSSGKEAVAETSSLWAHRRHIFQRPLSLNPVASKSLKLEQLKPHSNSL